MEEEAKGGSEVEGRMKIEEKVEEGQVCQNLESDEKKARQLGEVANTKTDMVAKMQTDTKGSQKEDEDKGWCTHCFNSSQSIPHC